MIGKTLSHYKVLEKIGQGGMGEVYRAEDTNLSREVAIKVLPEQFTQDPQRLARFEREAQILASLNHPNIAAIHSFEHSDDVHFLVRGRVATTYGRTEQHHRPQVLTQIVGDLRRDFFCLLYLVRHSLKAP